jgi:hypothetical protein
MHGVILQIVVPAQDGTTISDPEASRFEAVAYSTSYGNHNGDGIASVRFEIFGDDPRVNPQAQRLFVNEEFHVRFCAFDGDPACGRMIDTLDEGYALDLSNGQYILRAQANTNDHEQSNWVYRTFTVDFPGDSTATPNPTATWTPPPTFTDTPSLTPTWTPLPTFTDTPSSTPTWTLSPTFTDTPSLTPTWTPSPTFTPDPTATPIVEVVTSNAATVENGGN